MPPPAIVRVELLCLGAVRQEAYTDSAGRFHFHLGKLDAAEQSAEEARRQDPSRRVPEIEYVLGLVQARKRNYAAAGQHMRTYLQHVVSSVAVDAVKRQLAEIEMLAGQFQEFDARPDRPPVRPLAPAR